MATLSLKKLVDCHDPLWESLMGIPWNLRGSALSNLQRSSLTLRSGALVLTWWGSPEWAASVDDSGVELDIT